MCFKEAPDRIDSLSFSCGAREGFRRRVLAPAGPAMINARLERLNDYPFQRLADLLELAQRAMTLRATLNDALPVEDSPAILLPLSVAQAERVLAALKGGER